MYVPKRGGNMMTGTDRWTFRKVSIAFAISCLTFGLLAVAQGKNDVVSTLTAQKVVQKQGQEVFEPGDRAKPGDVILYSATYVNKSQGVIRNLEPTLPIPPGTQCIPDTAKPKPTKASLDGRAFETIPIKLKTKPSGSATGNGYVAQTEYRALRWHLGELAPGKSVAVTARVKVLVTPPPGQVK
jgi:uncharacterized repeat protein (TIGR01451 family)